MKKNIFKAAFAVAAISVIGMGTSKAYKSYTANLADGSSLLSENVLALSEGSSDWFAALRPVDCTITKTNGGGGFYYKGVWIAAGATYTVYGTRKECCFNLFNTCDVSQQTGCVPNN